jgi:hypothetical protein
MPAEKLQQFEANGWHVVAYAQTMLPSILTATHHFVVRHDPESAYAHRMERCRSGDAHNLRAQLAKEGSWQLCGQAAVSGDMRSLIFKRLLPEGAARLEVDDADEDFTLTLSEPLSTVPASLLFTTESGHRYDIDELCDLIESKGVFKNFQTGAALTPIDLERLFAHPSEIAAHLTTMLDDNLQIRKHLTPLTSAHLQSVAATLASDDPARGLQRSTEAIAAFNVYALGISASERMALAGARFHLTDTHGAAFTLSIMAALIGLQNGAGCSRATARYLKQIADEINS